MNEVLEKIKERHSLVKIFKEQEETLAFNSKNITMTYRVFSDAIVVDHHASLRGKVNAELLNELNVDLVFGKHVVDQSGVYHFLADFPIQKMQEEESVRALVDYSESAAISAVEKLKEAVI